MTMHAPALRAVAPSRPDTLRVSWEVAGFAAGLVLLSIAQLALGADVLIVLLCVSSVVIGFTPILALGRDLYTILAALFAFRYTGAALIAKTWYGQPLDSNLNDPSNAFLLVNVLMLVEVFVILLARRLDRGRTIFPEVRHPEDLRFIGAAAFAIGLLASLSTALLGHRESEGVSSGAAFVVASALTSLLFLGYAAELIYTYHQTRRREFISRRLSMMLLVTIVLSLYLNVRSMTVNAFLCIFLAAFLLNAIRPRHVFTGTVALFFFAYFVSPISLELRGIRFETSAGNFAGEVTNTVIRATFDPAYLAEIRARDEYRVAYESGIQTTDYYKNNSIANRASFVALLDAVADRTKVTPQIGMEAVWHVYERIVPGFLVNKELFPYGYGDWLTWRLGLIELGRIAFLNFGLPMEGLAVFGMTGFVLFPVIFMLPVLLLCGRIASLRQVTAPSLFLIGGLQWSLVEGTSDTFISLLTRVIPISVLPAFGLYWFWVQSRPAGQAARIEAVARSRPRSSSPASAR